MRRQIGATAVRLEPVRGVVHPRGARFTQADRDPHTSAAVLVLELSHGTLKGKAGAKVGTGTTAFDIFLQPAKAP